MSDAQLGDLSNVLFSPTTILLYLVAMGLYLYANAFTRVARADGEPAVAGVRALRAATVVAGLGLATHLGHLIARSLASGGRVPWGNMFEYSSVMGFGVVLAGLVIFQWRLRRPQVVGFLILGAVLTMAAALLVYTEPGPLQPILNSHWLKIHVLAIMAAATIFTVGFVFNGLHLLRDTAERRVADGQLARTTGSTVGDTLEDGAGDTSEWTGGRGVPDDVAEGGVSGPAEDPDDRAYRLALRSTIDPWRLFAGVWLGTAALSWVFAWDQPAVQGIGRAAAVNTTVALAALVARWFLPSLPSATTLDSLAYRTIAFAFPIWTFAVIAGAIWAEQSWGRYWGWDPKETSAFLTWVAYAAYLHARATRGVRGRGAAWLGIVAFGVLMFTYYAVNLVLTGLHSYAGL